jgi:hypothetical protein
MGDRLASPSRVRMSEDIVCRKRLVWVCEGNLCPIKAARCKRAQPRRGGTLQNGIGANSHGFTGACVAVA